MDLAIFPAYEFSHRHFSDAVLRPQCHDADLSPHSVKKSFPIRMSRLTGALGRLYCTRKSLPYYVLS